MKEKKCLIGYITGILDKKLFGNRISAINECCDEFKKWFNTTGNRKTSDFNESCSEKKYGLNFTTNTKNPHIELTLTHPDISSKISCCPFCETKIELKQIATLTLKRKYKKVFDGFET